MIFSAVDFSCMYSLITSNGQDQYRSSSYFIAYINNKFICSSILTKYNPT